MFARSFNSNNEQRTILMKAGMFTLHNKYLQFCLIVVAVVIYIIIPIVQLMKVHRLQHPISMYNYDVLLLKACMNNGFECVFSVGRSSKD